MKETNIKSLIINLSFEMAYDKMFGEGTVGLEEDVYVVIDGVQTYKEEFQIVFDAYYSYFNNKFREYGLL